MGTGVLAELQRQRLQRPLVDLGDEDPLYTRNLTNGPPDRRRVSLRWLAGSVLTGLFSAVLVGGALQAAIGLDEYAVVRPALAHGYAESATDVAVKGDRFRPVPENKVSQRVIQISTVTRENDKNIVRVRPFAHVHTRSRCAGRAGDRLAHSRIPSRRDLHRQRRGPADGGDLRQQLHLRRRGRR